MIQTGRMVRTFITVVISSYMTLKLYLNVLVKYTEVSCKTASMSFGQIIIFNFNANCVYFLEYITASRVSFQNITLQVDSSVLECSLLNGT